MKDELDGRVHIRDGIGVIAVTEGQILLGTSADRQADPLQRQRANLEIGLGNRVWSDLRRKPGWLLLLLLLIDLGRLVREVLLEFPDDRLVIASLVTLGL